MLLRQLKERNKWQTDIACHVFIVIFGIQSDTILHSWLIRG